MRRCTSCGEAKPLTDFNTTRWMCKPCGALYDSKRKNRILQPNVERNDTDAARARKRRWAAINRDPAKEAARRATREAVAKGLLTARSECETCGNAQKRRDGVSAVQAHHDDYARPLDVKWLCAKCHTAVHKKYAAMALDKP